MEETKFVYKAFISYTARDSQFVSELQKWLFHLAEYTDAEQKYKFFRDSSYSEVGENVEENLKQNLMNSEWLIVVCSPYVNEYKETERNWVEFECGYYAHTLGRKDHIVCIISNTAPLGRDISLFYPKVIRDLQKKLAADMRGDKKWGEETSRIYAKITHRKFEEVYEIANTYYWETQYYDRVISAYEKNREGNNKIALKLLAEIPDRYNPAKIEWKYIKALCSRSAYEEYCGRLNQPAGNKVIWFDKTSSYAYTTNNQCIYSIDCLQAKVVSMLEAHNGTPFRFFYIGNEYIGTFDNQIIVKIWKCDKEKITLTNQITIKMPFSQAEPEIFKAFYLDCQIQNIPVAYHATNQLLALTTRHTVFLINVKTMEYKTIEIPLFKKSMMQLSCVWKKLIFSPNGTMLFLANERYIVGWNVSTSKNVFCWNRKWCQPTYLETTTFRAENTTHSILLCENGQQAQWKEEDCTLLYFDTIPRKKLNSVYTIDNSTAYMILLYEGNVVQILEKNSGVVYMEEVFVEQTKTDLDFPQQYCPIAIWQEELWHLSIYPMQKFDHNEKGQALHRKFASYSMGRMALSTDSGLTAIVGQEGDCIAIYNEEGLLLREKEVCIKKQPTMLSDKELNLPEGTMVSELLRKYISKSMDQEIHQCHTITFIDRGLLLIGCTKGYLYLWEIENDILTNLNNPHQGDITIIEKCQKWNSVVTVDSEGIVSIWHYQKNTGEYSLTCAFSVHTQKKSIVVQLLSEYELAVFCNDTQEVLLYSDQRKELENPQVLLSARPIQKDTIEPALSMYVTVDRSRVVICRQSQIEFVRIPDGKIILESQMHGKMKKLKIDDEEKKMRLVVQDPFGNDFVQTYDIASMTDKELDTILMNRRLQFFSDAI